MSSLRAWTPGEDKQLLEWAGTFPDIGKKLGRTAAACRARKQTLNDTNKETPMATSSKIQFKLETLKEKAVETIDLRIKQAQLEVDSYEDAEAQRQRVQEWRDAQASKIMGMAARIGEGGMDDHTLTRFKIDPIPEIKPYEKSRAEFNLSQLEVKKSSILAKTEALVPDKDGNISLTKTQMAEFFGL